MVSIYIFCIKLQLSNLANGMLFIKVTQDRKLEQFFGISCNAQVVSGYINIG